MKVFDYVSREDSPTGRRLRFEIEYRGGTTLRVRLYERRYFRWERQQVGKTVHTKSATLVWGTDGLGIPKTLRAIDIEVEQVKGQMLKDYTRNHAIEDHLEEVAKR